MENVDRWMESLCVCVFLCMRACLCVYVSACVHVLVCVRACVFLSVRTAQRSNQQKNRVNPSKPLDQQQCVCLSTLLAVAPLSKKGLLALKGSITCT
jgi:hypothetical protein